MTVGKKRTNKITLIVCNKPIRREDATSDIVGETHRHGNMKKIKKDAGSPSYVRHGV